jgi:ketosteroid isomerase-like protein
MQDNKLVVEQFLTALGSGNGDAIAKLITEDVAAICTGTSVLSMTRTYSDIVGTVGMLKQVTQNGIAFKILELTAEADRVSCEAEGTSTLINGVPYNNQYHFLFYIRDGKVYKLKEYIDTKLADATLGALQAG